MRNPDDGTPNRKSTLWGWGCLLSPFLLILGLFLLTPLYNNFRLRQFERNFAAMAHPPQSKFVARTQEVGLFGNGNHCDFFVAELRSSSSSQNTIRKFYQSTRVAVPNSVDEDFQGVKNGSQPVEIEFLPSPLPANYRWNYHYNEPWNLSHLAGQKNLYIVLILNSGASYGWESWCDLRCT